MLSVYLINFIIKTAVQSRLSSAPHCATVAGCALKISKKKSTDIKSDDDDDDDEEGVKGDDASVASRRGKLPALLLAKG